RVVRHIAFGQFLAADVLAFVKFVVLWSRTDERPVRSIWRDVSEERSVIGSRAFRVDPLRRLSEKQIGAVAFRLDERAVVTNRGIKILVVGSVAATAGI